MSPWRFLLLFCMLPDIGFSFTSTNTIFQGDWWLDIQPIGIPLEAFSFDFVFAEQGVWTVAHITNPFMLTMILQDPWIVFLLVILFESVEATVLVFAQSTYLLFLNDPDSAEAENIGESLVGDVLQGALGVLLAKLLILVYKIPSWTPSVWGPYRRIWTKRIFTVLLLQPAFSLINGAVLFQESSPWRYGLEFAMLWLVGIWALLLRWNWSIDEQALFWRRSNREHFELVYNAWFVTALVLLGTSLVYFTYPYFQSWAVYLCIVGWHLVALALQGRFWELWYALDLGFRKQAFYYHQKAARA